MKLVVEPGKYVVAVSGGVDSMVLLELLRKQLRLDLVVAHFDHGIRSDSSQDLELVEQTAKAYGLAFEYKQATLGENASEETARDARYNFLYTVLNNHAAKAIITAHHQDDLLETALINLLRGTGRKGLSSLGTNKQLVRPLLGYTKATIRQYAEYNRIVWREDSTNQNTDYLRNYLRLEAIPRFSSQQLQQLLDLVTDAQRLNAELDYEIANLLQSQQTEKTQLARKLLITVPYKIACEIAAEWLRQNGLRNFDRKAIERLVIAARTFRPGQRVDVHNKKYVLIGQKWLVFKV